MKKYDIMGHQMVKLESLGYAIRESKKLTEMLYGDDKNPEVMKAVGFALDDIVRRAYADELRSAKTDDEKDAVVIEIPGNFLVYKPGEKKHDITYFDGWGGKNKAYTTMSASHAMTFAYESKASEVAAVLNQEDPGWKVADLCEDATTDASYLLNAIFSEPGDE